LFKFVPYKGVPMSSLEVKFSEVENNDTVKEILRQTICNLDDLFYGKIRADYLLSVCLTNLFDQVIATGFSRRSSPVINEKVFLLAVKTGENKISEKTIIEPGIDCQYCGLPLLFYGYSQSGYEDFFGFAFCVISPYAEYALDAAQTAIARAQKDYQQKQMQIKKDFSNLMQR
jgi:hypothetical protein